MDILISNNTDQPIYEQIREQIKLQIINGVLKEGKIEEIESFVQAGERRK